MENPCAHEPTTLNKLTLQSTLICLVALLSSSAVGQGLASTPALLTIPQVRGTVLAPNFRVAEFRVTTSDESENDEDGNNVAPDALLDPPADYPAGAEHQGIIKRSVRRIGADQKRLYLAPFEPHNFKWDAVLLIGTGAFLAADRHIENNVSHSNFSAYQNVSNIALAGLATSLAGVYLYGFKTGNEHAKETGAIELETLVNTFLIYAPMQLIAGRQRPDEGNNHGDFLKHHSLNTSFPGGHAMFTWAMASVLADEYPKPWARLLSYGAAFTVTFSRFMARDHWSSDMFLGMGLGLAIAENTFHARCDPELPSQCKGHQRWWKPMPTPTQ